MLYFSLPLSFQGQQLKVIEQELLEQLVEQIKLLSESVVSDLERTAAELQTEPQDLNDLSKYAVMVQKYTHCILARLQVMQREKNSSNYNKNIHKKPIRQIYLFYLCRVYKWKIQIL